MKLKQIKKLLVIFNLVFFSTLIFTEEKMVDVDPEDAELQSQKKAAALKKIESKKIVNESYILLRQGKYNLIPSKIQKLKETSPDSNEPYYFQAAMDYSQKKYENAIRNLKKSISISSEHDRSLYLLGMCYSKQNDWKKAIEYFQNAANADPYNPFYRLNLSIAYFLSEKYEDSYIHSLKAIELKKNFSEPSYILLYSLDKLQKYDEFLTYYGELPIDKKEQSIYEIYLMSLYNKKEFAEVIRILGIKKNLNTRENSILVNSYIESGNIPSAISTIESYMKKGEIYEKDLEFYVKYLTLEGKDKEATKVINSQANLVTKNKLLKKREEYNLMKKVVLKLYHPFP